MTDAALVRRMADAVLTLIRELPGCPADVSTAVWFAAFPEATSADRSAALALAEAEMGVPAPTMH